MCLPVNPYKVEKEWESYGLKCAVVQGREAQFRCGYVRVPPGHAMHGRNYDNVDVEVHGGLTFAEEEPCAHEDGQGWWFGFDCAHAGDASIDLSVDPITLSPGAARIRAVHVEFPVYDERFWTQEEVEQETRSLALQLAAMA
jgi:hypothetical protein